MQFLFALQRVLIPKLRDKEILFSLYGIGGAI
jgi:hypothetical protein